MSGYPYALVLCLATITFIVQLLRTRRLREKYAAIWLVVLVAAIVLGAFPDLLERIANLTGVVTPTNLLFATSLVVLLLVCIQLSTELSTLEEETRTLAEEVALLDLRVRRLEPTAPARLDVATAAASSDDVAVLSGDDASPVPDPAAALCDDTSPTVPTARAEQP